MELHGERQPEPPLPAVRLVRVLPGERTLCPAHSRHGPGRIGTLRSLLLPLTRVPALDTAPWDTTSQKFGEEEEEAENREPCRHPGRESTDGSIGCQAGRTRPGDAPGTHTASGASTYHRGTHERTPKRARRTP